MISFDNWNCLDLAVSKDCQLVAILDVKGKMNVFSQTKRSIIHTTYHPSEPGYHDIMRNIHFSEDGLLLLTATHYGYVNVWDSETKKLHEITVGRSSIERVHEIEA